MGVVVVVYITVGRYPQAFSIIDGESPHFKPGISIKAPTERFYSYSKHSAGECSSLFNALTFVLMHFREKTSQLSYRKS